MYDRSILSNVLTRSKKPFTRLLFSSISDIFSDTEPIKSEILLRSLAIPAALSSAFWKLLFFFNSLNALY